MAQALRQPVAMSGELTARIMFAGRSSSLSAQIVADVRDRLFAKKLKPGDFLGTEKDLAAASAPAGSWRATRCARWKRSASSRSAWAKAAARASRKAIRGCSPRRWPCSSISPALPPPKSWTRSARSKRWAPNSPPRTPAPPTSPNCARCCATPKRAIGDLDLFTRLSRDFHLAVAEASHNRVLVVQLISLEHVSWPRRNVTATAKLARHILDIHTQLTDLIEMRDAAAARTLMDDHVKMIRARRVAEHGKKRRARPQSCC